MRERGRKGGQGEREKGGRAFSHALDGMLTIEFGKPREGHTINFY